MPDQSLREHIALWKAASPEQWGRLALARDPLAHLFSAEQKAVIVADSLVCGREQADRFRAAFAAAPDLAEQARQLAAQMKIRIAAHDYPIGEKKHILFAQYENHEITVATGIVERIGRLMTDEDLWPLLDRFDAVAAIITHELYHCLEDENKSILTRTMKFPVKVWSVFPQRVTPVMAGEIAAFAFSQALCGWDYHPRIVEMLGIWSCNPENAKALTTSLQSIA